jgi:hypothetical protein
MKTATVLAFPSDRVRPAEAHTAKILVMPVKNPEIDILAFPAAVTLVWLSMFGF